MDIPVLPQNNLPDAAVPWGRGIQDQVGDLSVGFSRLSDTVTMNNRAMAGQMGVVGKQIQELYTQQQELLVGRRTDFLELSNFNLTASTPGTFVSSNRLFSAPEPFNGARTALVTLSGVITRTVPSTGLSSAGTFVRITRPGVTLVQDATGSVGGGVGAPPGFAARAFTFTFVDQVPATGVDYTFTAFAVTQESTSITLSYTNLSAVFQFQGLVE